MNPFTTPTSRIPELAGRRRYSVRHFLAALVVFLVSTPLAHGLSYSQEIRVGLFTLVLLSAVAAVGGRRRSHIIGIALMVPALAAQWATHF